MDKAMWLLMAWLNGLGAPGANYFSLPGFHDRAACEFVLKQIKRQFKPKEAACIYLAFREEDIREPLPDHAPEESPDHHHP